MNRANRLVRAVRASPTLLFQPKAPFQTISALPGVTSRKLQTGTGSHSYTTLNRHTHVSKSPLLAAGTGMHALSTDASQDPYHWIDEEAQVLIAKAYKRHKALADKSQSYPPSLSVKDLEKTGVPYHYEPKDTIDRAMLLLMKGLRVFVHAFFREKYDHHAVCLETVAAVPGLVGSFHRHLRSLRRMQRDHGWIGVLQEEAENERMHLLIFMQVCRPTALERALVITAQGLYLTFYSAMYLLSSRAAHRLTGYLEEEAHRAYTDYLRSIDEGSIENKLAPAIAREYYKLPDDARMRDVILHVRADEAMHRDVNHHFGNKYKQGDTDSAPQFMSDQVRTVAKDAEAGRAE